MLAFILLNVFSLLAISQAFILQSHSQKEQNICRSDDTSLLCECHERENITLATPLNFNIKWITIDGCGIVSIPLGAIPHLQLEEMVFSNLLELNILPFALVGVQTLNTLRIENVKNFVVRPHGFVGLLNVRNFIIKNVKSSELVEGSFGGVSTIENFHIENSQIDNVQDNVFILTNITSLTINKCKFDRIESNSFLIHVAKEVIFKDCDISFTSNRSICLSFVDSLSFIGCHFGIFASESIETKNLLHFQFESNLVEELKTSAFGMIDASENISLIRNVIKFAEEHSLFFDSENGTAENVEIYICCNYFTCDCSIYWLWEFKIDPFYEGLLKNSFCIEEDNELSSLDPVLDSHDNCKTLEKRIYEDSIPASSTNYEFVSISSSSLFILTKYCVLNCLIFHIGTAYVFG